MSSKQSVDAEKRADQSTRSRGRAYMIAGAVLTAALFLAVAAGMVGIVGPGLLTPTEAFLVVGVAGTILAVAVVGMLFSMNKTLNLLREQQAAIDDLQDKRARAVAEEQHRTDRSQESEITDLRSGQTPQQHSGTNNDPPRSTGSTPFGDLHRVLDVQGIGKDFSGQLGDIDILDTEQLWKADPDAVASQLDVRKKTVRNWQAMAELMAVNHIGPQYAELLVRADITSIGQLSDMDPRQVADRVRATEEDREVRIQGNVIGEKHTRKWVEEARDHDPQGVQIQR